MTEITRRPVHGWDETRLRAVAARYGTPVHVIDIPRVIELLETLRGVLDELTRPTSIHYSVKTNYLPALLRAIKANGAGADVVSGYEMDAVLSAGFAHDGIVFNGPVKTETELERAVDNGIFVNVDGAHEIDHLERIGAERGRPIPVGVRLSTSVPATTSADPTYRALVERAADRDRFGWPVESSASHEILQAIDLSPHLTLVGVHAHLGSQIVDPTEMLRAIEPIVTEAGRLHARSRLRVFNAGGGFATPGIRRPREGPQSALERLSGREVPFESEVEFNLHKYMNGLDRLMDAHGLQGVRLACEPGRWLVSDAMALLTTVVSRKEMKNARWLILDGGHNVAPWAGTNERHRIRAIGRRFSESMRPWSVAGPLCFAGDVHAESAEFPDDVTEGDIVCIEDTGAYSLGRSNNFNRTRAGVVAVGGDADQLVWRAESFEDVFRFADPGGISNLDGTSAPQ